MDPTKLRIGIGHDTHRLEAGGDLILGGVSVPHTHSLVGHSDADVLLHAITDAILGAAALGDIGELFPNTDDENKNRDSPRCWRLQLKKFAIPVLRSSTSTAFCLPKFQSFRLSNSPSLPASPRFLGVEESRVGVKAKTGESVGPVGNQEAMRAQAVALLVQTDDSDE